MVHALERARKHLARGGVLVCVQPRRTKRPVIALTAPGHLWPVSGLINPASEPLITAAEAAIDTVISDGRFALIGRINHQFRVRLSNPTQLDRYLHQGQRPPRFPAGGRSRLHALWKSRKPGTQIEVTEFMAIIALRAIDRFHD